MGLRSEKAVSAHLLLENAHESNLVLDIFKVDYLAGNLGRMHLRPLPGLPTFVVIGYLHREDCETMPKVVPSERQSPGSSDTDKKAKVKWRELYHETEPAGLFVAKVDV
ncbi:MAG: hypothetical protein AB2556_25210 [Candidatus Thiodiazotropha sp.]